MSETLLLIDGQSFCYRAFYAIRQLSSSKGEPTNAIYGFVTMLRKLLRDQKPDYAGVCFDRKEPTFRHKDYELYKAHRKPMPEELVQQIEPIKEFISAFRIPVFEMAGYEADDLLGTIAQKAERKGINVLIATGDKDALQLVNDRIKILNTAKEEVLDRKSVEKRFGGLGPEHVIEVMSLAGDSSDNIPGVPGVGEKIAVSLISEYGSVANLYKLLGDMKSASRAKALKENEHLARLSRELATIKCDVPVAVHLDEMKLQEPDAARLTALLKRYEFRSLLKEITPTGEPEAGTRDYHTVETESDFEALMNRLRNAKAIAVDTETTSPNPMAAKLVGMSFSMNPMEAYYVPLTSEHHQGPGLDFKNVKSQIAQVLEDPKIRKYGQNIKYDYIVLQRHGITLAGIAFDTMIASYLLNPLKLNHNLDDISFEYLGVKKIALQDLIGSGKKQVTIDQVPLERVSEYAAEDVDCVMRLAEVFEPLLEERGLTPLFQDVEMPLVEVLAQMESNGVALEEEFMRKLSKVLERDLDSLTQVIYREAGAEFNINSTKQLSEVLFTNLKLPIIKRTKTGYSTDSEVLEKLAQTYELPKRLLEYREKSKLKSTYVDNLPELVDSDTGLLHTSFNQTTTATGRLSSSEPNLQNIPIKTDEGRQIRRAFVPRSDKNKIMSADYSQVELRILAHFSEDPKLMQAFQDDLDVHQFTATLLYGTKAQEVTREMRNAAKTINFSIVYGVSAFGLAQSLGISVSEAQAFIDSYFARYSGVKDYLERQKETARQQGFLKTILGRRSYFPEIMSPNPTRRQFAERAAINAPIQGSAADVIKLAMIEIQKELNDEAYESLMILQVHDELVFDAPSKEVSDLERLVRAKMEGAYRFKVPLKVDVTVGDSWYKA